MIDHQWQELSLANINDSVIHYFYPGLLTLSPMTVVPVCHVGDQLQIICTASLQFIRWNILQPNEQGTLAEPVNPVQINSRDANQMPRIITVNYSTFIFTRTSALGDLPLNTTLSIDSVNIDLNGTVVCCTDVANPTSSASTTISIISNANSTVTLSKL